MNDCVRRTRIQSEAEMPGAIEEEEDAVVVVVVDGVIEAEREEEEEERVDLSGVMLERDAEMGVSNDCAA